MNFKSITSCHIFKVSILTYTHVHYFIFVLELTFFTLKFLLLQYKVEPKNLLYVCIVYEVQSEKLLHLKPM